MWGSQDTPIFWAWRSCLGEGNLAGDHSGREILQYVGNAYSFHINFDFSIYAFRLSFIKLFLDSHSCGFDITDSLFGSLVTDYRLERVNSFL